MKAGPVTSLTSIAAVLLCGAAYLTFGVVRVDWFDNYTTATMVLTNSGSLGPHSPVLLSGVKVGEVTSVDNTADGVAVEFRVDDKFDIPLDSSVTIENLSALGEPYVQFTAHGVAGPYLENGQRVATRTIAMPLSIPDVARTVTELLNQLDPEAIGSLIETFYQGTAGTENVVPQLARATDLLAATILSRTPELRSAMIDLQTIAADMSWAGPAMAESGPLFGQFGQRAEAAADAIGRFVNKGTIPDDYTTGTGLAPFVNTVSAYLDRVGPDLAQLVPVLQPLATVAGSAFRQIDLSSLIAQALEAIGDDGAIHLQIHVK